MNERMNGVLGYYSALKAIPDRGQPGLAQDKEFLWFSNYVDIIV